MSRVDVRKLSFVGDAEVLKAAISDAITNRPLSTKLLNISVSEISGAGETALRSLGIGAPGPANTGLAIGYEAKGARVADGLAEVFPDSILLSGSATAGVILVHHDVSASTLSLIHGGARSPAGKSLFKKVASVLLATSPGQRVIEKGSARI